MVYERKNPLLGSNSVLVTLSEYVTSTWETIYTTNAREALSLPTFVKLALP